MFGDRFAEERSASSASNQTSEYSNGNFSSHLNNPWMTERSSSFGYVRPMEMRIKAAAFSDLPPERMKDYKGRIRTWPGLLLMVLVVGGALTLMTQQAMKENDRMRINVVRYEQHLERNRKIEDGKEDDEVIISDDGQVGNPKKYPDMGCELPDYQSKNGQIFAVSKNGTEVPVGIKGVNWFGMETSLAIPFGLWENMDNGTSVYEIAAFLARNNFNSVRLPVCIKNILKNTAPDKTLINLNTNRAINVTTYMSTIQTIVEALGYRHITVMISLHTLDPKKSGGAWYDEDLGVSEDDFLQAVDTLASNLCESRYWNILGLDLKNEPHTSSWGGDEPDWQKGATLIGNRMLEGCPNWMAFVEGVNGVHQVTVTGDRTDDFYDWWGGGLEEAGDDLIEYNVENKLVWAPHYYNTGVSPQWYLYASGEWQEPGTLQGYVELSDEELKANVDITMDLMFGYLMNITSYAMVLGEFAGLYSKDAHPMLTTRRTTDYNIQVMIEKGYAGGYMWSLNPESAYQYNPADVKADFTEGLLEDDWLTSNKVFLEGMAAMDSIKDLQRFPCFPLEIEEDEER